MPADTPRATAAVDAAATDAAASGDPAEASPSCTTTKKRQQQHWTPLEANPDVFTSFARRLGLPAASAHFVDVYGLDEVSLCGMWEREKEASERLESQR